ncbi:MAG: hypothetical protein Barrevirus1_62 [Barrevirus sp.]|uniref:VWFA domain-containing protein n=1 Tax=Barrevirus sp. TaxID=2487763 RepID=A0A3G4ZPL5_9VIRU|nr:MAG: hypothetical protein Barrevirus1_62 [Barrevirus sp.]
MNQDPSLDRFNQLVKQHELTKKVADDLQRVLTTCEIVLLCDDSGSMNSQISEEGADPFNPKKTTRWLELKKLAAALIDIITATNPEGLDIYFLNRDTVFGVNNMANLSATFSVLPNGSTNITAKLQEIYIDKRDKLTENKQLLILVITDGEPTDNTSNPRQNLYDQIRKLTNLGNIHISFAECTDQEEDMDYLDVWDNKLRNFDNTEDYRDEVRRVKAANGQAFKFDYTDYVIKILLATFVKSYFNLDQNGYNNNNYQNVDDDCCCVIL